MRRENDGKIISETSIIKELVSCKFTIKEVEINVNHILVDEYSLRWNYIPIEGAYIFWFKELSYNITKIDLMLLDYVKDCFINSNGSNALIDWTKSFKLINNEITTSRNVTNREDAAIRCFRVKEFLWCCGCRKYGEYQIRSVYVVQ
ncbi:uncharacterized protein OCT59_015665 [Rhizophagus irregularis]|uniref:uncharacterized protein n=1 Tax=Rhizophagus irregularis TaxID=588596 RepID=UPI00331A73CB|nr:hypothetical protein OCT59_015665 [Rhizophagus irregularis]